MSLITYNSIQLPYPYITSFNQEAGYDEIAQTDKAVNKFDVSVQCIINAAYINQLKAQLIQNGIAVTDNPAVIMNVVREQLLRPRRALSVKFNGTELIPIVDDIDGDVDSANGPKPVSCNLTELTNTTFLMSYHITAQYVENQFIQYNGIPIYANRSGNNAIANRWSETLEYNNRNFVTRTREGKCFIRSDNKSAFIADDLLVPMCVVGVPSGCLRAASKYTVDPSGLAVSYNIVDKEVYKKPPFPAYEADGEYTESVGRAAARIFGQVRVHLKGDRLSNGAGLIDAAISVGGVRLFRRGKQIDPNRKGFVVLESASLRVSLYDNDVEFFCRAAMSAPATRAAPLPEGAIFMPPVERGGQVGKNPAAFAAFGNLDTFTPLTDGFPDRKLLYPVRGWLNLIMQAAAYYDPALRNTKLNSATGQLTAGVEVGEAGVFGE